MSAAGARAVAQLKYIADYHPDHHHYPIVGDANNGELGFDTRHDSVKDLWIRVCPSNDLSENACSEWV